MNNVNKINLSERIFLAGAYGMVGSSIYKILKKNSYGLKKNNGIIFMPKRKDLNLLNHNEVDYYFNKNKPTVVILAAAKVGGIYANSNYPADFMYENLKMQMNIIESAWQNQVKRLLFLGSSCIYPKFSNQPIEEESLLTGSLESTNQWYAISKITGIKLCEALREQYNFDAISLMPTNLYGTGDSFDEMNSHVMPALISKFYNAVKYSKKEVTCWGTGKASREFMHVDDLSKAIIFALENWNPDSSDAPLDKNQKPLTFLNVGVGKEITIRELAEKISEKVGFKGKIIWDKSKPDGTPKKLLNSDKIRSLGWEPLIELNDGIERTIKEFSNIKL
mgnify:CR=1 FL=1